MRRRRESRGCLYEVLMFTKSLIGFLIVLLVIIQISNSTNRSAGRQEQSETQTAESKETTSPDPTIAPTPEPSTLREWAEHVANAVYGSFDQKYSSLISVECEQVDGENAPMIIINAKYPDTFMRDNDERMGSFLYDAMKTTWKLNDLAKEGKIEYGSVFIHGRTTFLDKYGNEIEGDAASIRIKASEAAKVNWSLTTFMAEMMPGIAVSFMIHPVIRDGLSAEYLRELQK